MHSQLEIIAEYRSTGRSNGISGSGSTVIRSIRAGGHFAARQTAAGVIHLVGTAGGPLGGDEVTISVHLGPGACLAIRSAGGTVVQPGARRPDSRIRTLITVDDAAQLDLAPEPTVICRACEHEASTVVELSGSGQVRLLERVLLGRTNEPGGNWVGRTWLSRDGRPVLRHTIRSALIGADGTRVISTLLHSEPQAVPATWGSAAAMPLAAGGLLVTATGTALLPTQADLLTAAERALVQRTIRAAINPAGQAS
jgi:urease accessory protein